ncbi:MAG TPA: YcaO-like family protein, partial [Actinomycetota bacterium]
TAARKAVLEVAQVRPALRIRLRQAKARARLEELVANPALVSELEDHDLLYASRQWLRAFDFLRPGPLLDASWDDPGVNGPTHAGALEHLAEHCRRAGRHLLYSNLTPPDMETLGLFTVRVLIPGLQPIDFGANRIRLGGRRLFDLPVELGLRASPATWAELNPLPHPLA